MSEVFLYIIIYDYGQYLLGLKINFAQLPLILECTMLLEQKIVLDINKACRFFLNKY